MQVVELLCDWKHRGEKEFFSFKFFSRGFILKKFNDIFVVFFARILKGVQD